MNRGQAGVIAGLGTAQTLAWASSYYLPAVLANPIAADISLITSWVILGAAMSCGLYEAAFSALARIYGKEARSAFDVLFSRMGAFALAATRGAAWRPF